MERILGLNVKEAKKILNQKGKSLRVVKDVFTLEYNPNRIDVEVKNNIITKVLNED